MLLQRIAFSKELPVVPPARSSHGTRAIPASKGLHHSKQFSKHSSVFSRGQAQREVMFKTQLHRLNQQVALVDMQAQQVFREQQVAFEQGFSAAWRRHAADFQRAFDLSDLTFVRGEHDRQRAFTTAQQMRQSQFEGSQQRRAGLFERTCLELRRNAAAKEAKRAKEFLAWKERKRYEMEKEIRDWQRIFEEDERERDKRVMGLGHHDS